MLQKIIPHVAAARQLRLREKRHLKKPEPQLVVKQIAVLVFETNITAKLSPLFFLVVLKNDAQNRDLSLKNFWRAFCISTMKWSPFAPTQ
jgi:hypothetical protein